MGEGGGRCDFFSDYLELLIYCSVFSMVHQFSVGIFLSYSGPLCILGSRVLLKPVLVGVGLVALSQRP